jgi:phosphate acyltransferase
MSIVIAIDAMGGDFGPSVTVPAVLDVVRRYSDLDLKLILVGKKEVLEPMVFGGGSSVGASAGADAGATTNVAGQSSSGGSSCGSGSGNSGCDCCCCGGSAHIIKERIEIRHASEEVAMDESPVKALRFKKDSSMRVAIDLVKDGAAQACVSAGNTGALMATAHFVLKTFPEIERSAIIASWPTANPSKEVYVLDLGANVDSTAEHLSQFAVMGSVLVKSMTNNSNPRVGLLNIGSEEIKGNEQVKRAAQLIAENKAVNYVGYVEGDGVFSGDVDVVVCDGFIGNVTLKAVEGAVKLVIAYLKTNFMRNWLTKLVALAAKPVLKKLAYQLDPGRRNGASLIGLRGIVIKSHGGANVKAFANAVEEAIREVQHNVLQSIQDELKQLLQIHRSAISPASVASDSDSTAS